MGQLNTIEWIAIAAIVVQAIIAIGIGIWQIRVMRKLANPAANEPPPDTSSRTKKTHTVLIWIVLPLLSIVFPLIAVIIILFSHEPFTKLTAILISASMSFIVLGITTFFSVVLILKITDVIELMAHIIMILKNKIDTLQKTTKKKSRAG